jgi:hypothetical protein
MGFTFLRTYSLISDSRYHDTENSALLQRSGKLAIRRIGLYLMWRRSIIARTAIFVHAIAKRLLIRR